ncbi:unnamed protein product, partial [Prorocentrum cordatum]
MRLPDGDKLTGNMYLDGPAVEPSYVALRRAGAIAQCDDDGNVVAGVYGTAQRDLWPQQTDKDGDDFAVWMLRNYAGAAVVELNVECRSTVSCLRRGRAYATTANRLNTHLRARAHAAFEQGAFAVNKAQAHCTRQAVLDGKLTKVKRRGNVHADRLVKASIALQGIEAKDTEGMPERDERRHVQSAELAEEPPADEQEANRRRLGCPGDDEEEVMARPCRGAHARVGEGSGAQPKLKSSGVGHARATAIRVLASQRSLWEQGAHPAGRPWQARQRQRRQEMRELRKEQAVPE